MKRKRKCQNCRKYGHDRRDCLEIPLQKGGKEKKKVEKHSDAFYSQVFREAASRYEKEDVHRRALQFNDAVAQNKGVQTSMRIREDVAEYLKDLSEKKQGRVVAERDEREREAVARDTLMRERDNPASAAPSYVEQVYEARKQPSVDLAARYGDE